MVDETVPTQDRQITVGVPEDRVAEFYAFFARFLAGRRGPGRHGRDCRGRRPEKPRERIPEEVQRA